MDNTNPKSKTLSIREVIPLLVIGSFLAAVIFGLPRTSIWVDVWHSPKESESVISLEQLQAAMPGTPLATAQESVIPGLIEVTARDRVLYLDRTGRYLVIGSIYDLQAARDLTADRQAELTQGQVTEQVAAAVPTLEQMEELVVHASVRYGGDDPDLPHLIIFSDPQCGFCQRLHLQLVERTDLRVMELMYPIFPGSAELAAAVLCAVEPVAALTHVMQGGTLGTDVNPACLATTRSILSRSIALGRDLNVQGTPMLLTNTNGQLRRHDGFMQADALVRWLKQESN